MTIEPVLRARLCLILAALGWSTGSFFLRGMDSPHLGVNEPHLGPILIAFYRALFAALCLLPLLRRSMIRFKPLMAFMIVCFATMNALYLLALSQGTAANAIFLQNTAPFWVYILGILLLGHLPRRGVPLALGIALCGAFAIVIGNWPWRAEWNQQWVEGQVLIMAAGSGFLYALVVLCLASFHKESAVWLSILNLGGTALAFLIFQLLSSGPMATLDWLATPTPKQIGFLAIFGVVQLGLPYLLFAASLRYVSPTEAGMITLIEPILNPVWAYLLDPARDTPTIWTVAGGICLLIASIRCLLLPSTPKNPELVNAAKASDVVD